MGKPQSLFLTEFQSAFRDSFGITPGWITGQGRHNSVGLPCNAKLRRDDGAARSGEVFELGDLRADIAKSMVIVECESSAISVHNLMKYWPFIRGDMSIKPSQPVLLCHFSDWGSYGSHRDLWHWLSQEMSGDQRRLVDFAAEQFDHGGKRPERRAKGIAACVEWLRGRLDP